MTALRLGSSALLSLALLMAASVPNFALAADELELREPPPEDSIERITTERDLARARFEVSQADVNDLARRRLEAIRTTYGARFEEYRAGRGTLDSLRDVQQFVAHARQPLIIKTDVNREALEGLWRSVWHTEKLVHLKYASGQVKAADYYETLYFLLDAEVNLALSRPKKK